MTDTEVTAVCELAENLKINQHLSDLERRSLPMEMRSSKLRLRAFQGWWSHFGESSCALWLQVKDKSTGC